MNTNLLTTIIGCILAMLIVVQQNLGSVTGDQPVNWLSIVVGALVAGLGYLINKPAKQ